MRRILSIGLLFAFFMVKAQLWAPLSVGVSKVPVAMTAEGKFLAVAYIHAYDTAKNYKAFQISIWNSVYWHKLPLLESDTAATIKDLRFYQGGLYIGGSFGSFRNISNSRNIIRWKNREFQGLAAINSSVSNYVRVNNFDVFDGNLIVNGKFSDKLSVAQGTLAFNGTSVATKPSNYGSGILGEAITSQTTNNGTIYFGGLIFKANGDSTKYLASYSSTGWKAYPNNDVVPYSITNINNKIIFFGYKADRSERSFYTISNSGETVAEDDNIEAIGLFSKLHNVNGTVYASGSFRLGKDQTVQHIIRYTENGWVAIEKGDLMGAYLLTSYNNKLVTAGSFVSDANILLNRVSIYTNGVGAVTGRIFFDKSGDCEFNGNESNISTMNIHVAPDNRIIIPREDGTFFALLTPGQKTLTILTHKFWETKDCKNVKDGKITTMITSGELNANLDFPMTQRTGIKDVSILLKGLTGHTVPNNRNSGYILKYENLGSENVTATQIVLEFDDERMTLKNAEPHPKDEIGNKLYWDVNDFYAGNDGAINLSFAVASQSEEDIEMVATISQATGEGNFDDNTSRLLQALDDEDFEFKKEVLPNYGSDTAYLTDTSERVEYQITFSNYTDDTIRTVYVLDTIKLNHSMLHIKEIARSHNATVEALEGIPGEDIGVLLWTFHDINLPPNPTHNPEIVNHIGFVSFEIGLESDLTPGVMLTNTAHVTFDYFPTEPTNPVFAMIQQPAAIINTFKFSPLDIYPNPATNQISILENDAYANKEFRIISVQGNEMNSGLVNGSNSIDISSLSSGIYMVEIIKDKTVYRSKFIKI